MTTARLHPNARLPTSDAELAKVYRTVGVDTAEEVFETLGRPLPAEANLQVALKVFVSAVFDERQDPDRASLIRLAREAFLQRAAELMKAAPAQLATVAICRSRP